LDQSVKARQNLWAWMSEWYSIEQQHRRVPAREAREYRVPRFIRCVMDRGMPAMNVENKNSPSRADELPLCRVRFARVVARFQHPRIAMRPGDDPRRAVVLREVDESADRVAPVPHPGLTPQPLAPINV